MMMMNFDSFLFRQKYSSNAVSGVQNFLDCQQSKILPNRGLEIFRIVIECENKGSDNYYEILMLPFVWSYV